MTETTTAAVVADALREAERLLRESAQEYMEGISINGVPDWANEPETEAAYKEHIAAADGLAALASAAQAAPVEQEDALPREDFAWLVVQEACETEPADEDDPECIRILRRDLKSAVLAAFLRHDAVRAQNKEPSHDN